MKLYAILDRTREWERLQALWESGRPELAFVVGRRRVGKSFLLTRFAGHVGGVYFQATERTESEQLARLTAIVGEHFGDPALKRVSLPDWETLLDYVTERSAGRPTLLVLDEFPYLAAAAPALPSILQTYWDHRGPGTGLKLILSGSLVTAMKRLEAGNQPLYGRRTARFDIGPFGYRDAALFVPGYASRKAMLTYGVFGGLPGHLALLDPAERLSSNAARLLLDPSGRLADDAQHMLDAFLADAAVHYSIIEAIAGGSTVWSRITSRVGKDAGSLSRPMRWLLEMGLVSRVTPVTETRPERSKRAIYRITDPYVSFWHRFISPLVSAGVLGLVDPALLWKERVEPRLDEHMGPVFEEACRTFVRSGTARLPFVPMQVGEWWDAPSRDQIDVVALGSRSELLLAECKWGAVVAADLESLRARRDRLAREIAHAGPVHLALFSARPVRNRTVLAAVEAGDVLSFSLEDLYR